MTLRGKFPPLMIIRRYLKLTLKYCLQNNLLDKNIEEITNLELPFKIELLPTSFPQPKDLRLCVE